MVAVTLRAVRPEDLPVLFENQRDPASVELALVPARDRAAFDAHWTALLANPTVVSRAIDADGQLAGHIGAWEREGERQVGYWLGTAFRGRGVATKALRLLLELERFRPLHAHVAMANVASGHEVVADLNLGTKHAPIAFVDLHYRLD